MRTTVRTQAELDAALAATIPSGEWHYIDIKSPGGVWIELRSTPDSSTVTASGSSTVTAFDSSTVRAFDSSTVRASGSSTVTAFDSSTVRASGSSTVRACDSSTVRAFDSSTVRACDSSTVTAFDSSTVTASGSSTVTAFDSSTVRAFGSSTVTAFDSSTVRASGSSTVTASGSSTVRAGSHVAVHLRSKSVCVHGGAVIDVTELDLTDVAAWCDYAGAETDGKTVTIYKAVDANLKSERGFEYPIGAKVKPADWTDDNECGGGLHLSPSPVQAQQYFYSATRFLRCTAKIADVRPIPGGVAKCKVRKLRVIAEVDIYGREL